MTTKMTENKTLLRVDYVGANDYGFVIPAIDLEKIFYFNWRELPFHRKFYHGEKFHAIVNLDATTKAELNIRDWEFDTKN